MGIEKLELNDLELDIGTLLARLEQLEDELHVSEMLDGLASSIWDRIVTCDIPRLRQYV